MTPVSLAAETTALRDGATYGMISAVGAPSRQRTAPARRRILVVAFLVLLVVVAVAGVAAPFRPHEKTVPASATTITGAQLRLTLGPEWAAPSAAGRDDGVTSGSVSRLASDPGTRIVVGAISSSSDARDPLSGPLRPRKAVPTMTTVNGLPVFKYAGKGPGNRHLYGFVARLDGGDQIAMCSAAGAQELGPCAGVLATLSHAGKSRSFVIDPAVQAMVAACQRAIAAVRSRERSDVTDADTRLKSRAASLSAVADRYAQAVRDLDGLTPAPLDAEAVAALASAYRAEAHAWARLASAARQQSRKTFNGRRGAVASADDNVASAIHQLTIGGYVKLTAQGKNEAGAG